MLAVQAERMECNGMNGAASGVMGGSKRALPASKAVATYIDEARAVGLNKGLGCVFDKKP